MSRIFHPVWTRLNAWSREPHIYGAGGFLWGGILNVRMLSTLNRGFIAFILPIHRCIRCPTFYCVIVATAASLSQRDDLVSVRQRYYSLVFFRTIQASTVKKKHISTVPVHDRLRINAWKLFFFIISITVWTRHLLNCVAGKHQQLSSEISMAHKALNSGKADPKQPCLSNKAENPKWSCGEPAKLNELWKWTLAFHGLDPAKEILFS